MLRSIPIVEPALQPRRVPFAQPFQPDPSLVLWLLPQRDAKWHDYSGKGNHGTIHGAIWKAGIVGPVLDFDGVDDYVDCGNDTSFNNTDAIMLGVWVNLTNKNYNHIIWKENAYGFWSGSTGYFRAHVYVDGAWRYFDGATLTTGGVWHHVVQTYDSNTHKLRLFIDSNEDPNSPYTLPDGLATYKISTNSNLVLIGDTGENSPNGTIGEVMIFNRAPNAAEIARIFRVERGWYGV